MRVTEKTWHRTTFYCALIGIALAAATSAAAEEPAANAPEPFGAAVIIIELTDNDIELQVFADAFDWDRLVIADPNERVVFETRARGRLKQQGGLSELLWASEPSHYLLDEPDYDEEVEDFLRRWPQGSYEFFATRLGGLEPLYSKATLSHVLAAIPEITAPEDGEIVSPEESLLISWEPVTTRFNGPGPVTIIEYQVIVSQETPQRGQPWIDGGTRRSLINLPGDVTEIMVPAEILEPDATYEIEILAIEQGGNSTIGVVEFETTE